MSPFAIALTPVVAKLIMKFYLGPTAAEIGGTALTVAIKKFGDKNTALEAEGHVKKAAAAIITQLEAWLAHESSLESNEFWAFELADSIETEFTVKMAVEYYLDGNSVAQQIINARSSDWSLSGPHVVSTMSRLVVELCKVLLRVAPTLAEYEFTRDSQILISISNATSMLEFLISGQRDILSKIDSYLSPAGKWELYENKYRNAVSSNLDYVEILGLDLRPERRNSKLSVAYLSLTIANGDAETEDERASFEEVLQNLPRNQNRLIIEGGAGSGKSTVLRWTAIRCANPVSLGARPDDLLLNNLTEEDFKTAGATEGRLHLERLVPFLVRLRDLEGKTLPALEELPRLLFPSGPCPDGWVENLLETGRAIILFDGVDEVSEENGVRARLLSQIQTLSLTYPHSVMIVAGRPGAFSRSPFGDGIGLQVQVNEMDDEERDEFVSRWHRARAEQLISPEEKQKIIEYSGRLKAEFARNAALRRMASNPLLAASICALHEISPSTTPRTEHELCERLSKMLISERDLAEDYKGVSVDVESLGKAYSVAHIDKQTIISRIAGQMLNTGESVLSWKEALSVVEDALYRVNLVNGVRPEAMLRSLELRSGVVRSAVSKRGQDEGKAIEFIHNRFKEWFAAIYFLDKGQHTELANKLPGDPYDQVALFAVSAAGSEDFACKLVTKVRERIDDAMQSNGTFVRQMKLVAVRLNEAARQLPRELKVWAVSLHSEMFPPRNKTEARALALLGDAAVPFLKRDPHWGARETAAAVFCLRQVGSASALSQLEEYASDRRWTVGQEVALSLDPIKCAGVTARLNSSQRIDASTRSRIVDLTNIPSGQVNLDLFSSSLRSIDGIQKCKNLKYLDVSRTKIDNIDAISNLTKIQSLSISGTSVKSISALSGLLSLEILTAANCRINSITPIIRLKKLSYIDISSNVIEDVERVTSVASLSDLHINRCGLKNIDFVASLNNVTTLNIGWNEDISDISSVRKMEKINILQISSMKNLDIKSLGQVDSLRRLTMAGYPGRDLSGIGNYQIEWILMDMSSVSDISEISKYKNLKRFDADNTDIEDLSPLMECEALEVLYLSGSKNIDIDVINMIPKLKELHISFDANVHLQNFRSDKIQLTYH